ncbi:MAG: hypothetical protein ACXVEF_32280 [Polyangiales bacterium]
MAEKKTTPAVPESLRKMLSEYSVAREKVLADAREVTSELQRDPRNVQVAERALTVRAALQACADVGGDDAIMAALAVLDRMLTKR